MLKSNDFMVSTSAKVFLNDWGALRDIISKHTMLVKDAANPDVTPQNPATSLFSDRQMDDALNGPYQSFIKQKMAAYATLSKVRFKLTVQQDENLKEFTHSEEDQNELNAFLGQTSLSNLDKMQNELDELTRTHHQAWQAQLTDWRNSLVSSLNQANLPLTDREVEELNHQEPASELFARFVDLKIETPKKLDHADDYSKYYTLKTMLAISSSLARQHKPSTEKDIEPILKKLKSNFEAIHQSEKTLIKTQQGETDAVVQPIAQINTLLKPKKGKEKKEK